jgi:hypothetical protein
MQPAHCGKQKKIKPSTDKNDRVGYQRYSQADHQLSFSTVLVYTKDDDICSQLAVEKRKPLRY